MEIQKSEKDWNYAYYTFRTGTRPFDGIEMILENMILNFERITSHPCGSFSTTNDLVARVAVSNTAIVMSYSLLEGFFHEEYTYYLKNKKTCKPKELSALINSLLHEHAISITDWREKKKKVDLLRVLRNAAVHCNGVIEEKIDRNACKEAFGEDIFQSHKSLPMLSLDNSISLIRECRDIAHEYSMKLSLSLTNQCSRPPALAGG